MQIFQVTFGVRFHRIRKLAGLLRHMWKHVSASQGFTFVKKCGKAAEAKRDLFFEQTLEDETRFTR